MIRKSNKNLTGYAKELRNNMTREEKHLWYDFLKDYPLKFRRQKIIGKYIVDFYCDEAKIVIELDGSQHFGDNGINYDKARTEFFSQYDLKVVRIPNNEVSDNFEGVCNYIDDIVKKRCD